MTNTESDHIGGVWYDRYKIVGKYRHVVAVNSETLNSLSAAVDEPKSVSLPGVEFELGKAGIRRALLAFVRELGAVEAHLAVDQVAVREWGKRVRGRGHDFFDNLFVCLVIPIAEENWSDVVVILYLTWTVDDHSACDTGRVLSAIVRVIPRCAVNIRKEGIGHALSRGNRALGDSRNAVVPRSSLL